MDWPRQQRKLLADHSSLQAQHRQLLAAQAQLHELREHHENLQSHHSDLANYETELASLPPPERTRLTLMPTIEATEVMLTEAAKVVEDAREAWRKATKMYQTVRNMLDRED
jgi:hypothetical protein